MQFLNVKYTIRWCNENSLGEVAITNIATVQIERWGQGRVSIV